MATREENEILSTLRASFKSGLLTYEDLGRALVITPQSAERKMSGKQPITLHELTRLGRLLRLEISVTPREAAA